MRVTQGTFSFLPDLTDDEVRLQLEYCLRNGWPVAVEHTDDPHPRNVYWAMWGLPLFDQTDATLLLEEVRACRAAYPRDYVRVTGYDRRLGRQTTALSFLVQRPAVEEVFELRRAESRDRQQRYALVRRPSGDRGRSGEGS